MSAAFGVNRYTQAYTVAVNDAGTRIADRLVSCVDRLVWDLWKYAGALEAAWRFFYPFVGGTAVSHSFNLIDPKYGRIEWSGNVTHNANGITGDGATGFGATGVTIGTAAADGLLFFGHYCRTASAATSSEIGNYAGTIPGFLIQTRWTNGNCHFYIGGYVYFAAPNSQGLFTVLRTDTGGGLYGYRNAAYVTGAVSGGYTPANPPLPFYVLARRGHNTDPSIMIEHSSRNLALYFLSKGTYAQYTQFGDAANFYNNVVQPFQTRLGRQV